MDGDIAEAFYLGCRYGDGGLWAQNWWRLNDRIWVPLGITETVEVQEAVYHAFRLATV